MTVDFYFDPACPWTWYTATWLTTVAQERDLEIHGHPMSLWEINNHETPADYRDEVLLSRQALRLVQELDDQGRYADLWQFYRELGSRIHNEGFVWSIDVIEESATAAGIENYGAINDDSFDPAIAAVTAKAMTLGGQNIGSPVLVPPNTSRGFHGPIVTEDPMSTSDAVALWEAITQLTSVPAFYEIKNGRG